MRKFDKIRFYELLDEMQSLLDDNTIMSKKDTCLVTNELVNFKMSVEQKCRSMRWKWNA